MFARRGELRSPSGSGQVEQPLGHAGITSWMGAPMLLGEQVYGVIILQSYDESVIYSPADLDLLNFMASHVAVAISRMESERVVRHAHDTLAEQNAALITALVALREAQSELVRQEKLASLGALVAGVAHEIKPRWAFA